MLHGRQGHYPLRSNGLPMPLAQRIAHVSALIRILKGCMVNNHTGNPRHPLLKSYAILQQPIPQLRQQRITGRGHLSQCLSQHHRALPRPFNTGDVFAPDYHAHIDMHQTTSFWVPILNPTDILSKPLKAVANILESAHLIPVGGHNDLDNGNLLQYFIGHIKQ
jgi:hypothetical protein